MGLFRNKTTVHIMGNRSGDFGADGRYRKQAKENRRREKEKLRNLVLEPRSTAELRGYIEAKYGVSELRRDDDRYKLAYLGIKAHLVFRDAPELLTTPEMPAPNHPPRSENDPDYLACDENREKRYQEALHLTKEQFLMHLHVYNIPISQGSLPVAWLEVYVETDHEYLAFKVVELEYSEHYSIDRTREDIIRFFGAGPEDQAAGNERYIQYLSVM